MVNPFSFSQGTNFSPSKQKYLFAGGSFSILQTGIMNTDSLTGFPVKSEYRLSPGGSINAGYQFSKYFGISAGIGFSSFVTDISVDSYTLSFDTTDSEKQSYNRRVAGNEIKETQKVTFINVPVLFMFQLPVKSRFGLYLETGLNLSFPFKTEYSSYGTFTYTGFYPAYNALIKDIPYEEFKSDIGVNKAGSLNIKKICPELLSSAGLWFNIKSRIQLSAGFCYNRMLTDISEYTETKDFRLSTRTDHIKSIMSGSDQVKASSMGLKIAFRYIL